MITTTKQKTNAEKLKREKEKTAIVYTMAELKEFVDELCDRYKNPVITENNHSLERSVYRSDLQKLCESCTEYQTNPLKEQFIYFGEDKIVGFISRRIDRILKMLPSALVNEYSDKNMALDEEYKKLTFEQRINMTQDIYDRLESIRATPGEFGNLVKKLKRSVDALACYLFRNSEEM